jgi:hypothetical protein
MALKPSVYLIIFRLPDENVQFEHIREIMDLLNIVIHRIEYTDHDDIEIVKGDIPTPRDTSLFRLNSSPMRQSIRHSDSYPSKMRF